MVAIAPSPPKAPLPPKAPPCVPVGSLQPVAVHPTPQNAETWHHHHHHAHAVATAPAEPVVGTTPVPHAVANPTTPMVHIDVNAAFPVEAKPAVAPVVVNPAHKPAPTLAPAPVAAAAPAVVVDAPAVAVDAPAAVAAPVAAAAPAAGTCCNEGIRIC